MEAGVRLPLNMKYYELLSIYQYLDFELSIMQSQYYTVTAAMEIIMMFYSPWI